MAIVSKEYDVEKILRRKIGHRMDKNGIYYFIKWLHYDESYNTWEPECNLNCDDLVEEFIDGNVIQIDSAKRTPYGIDYWIKYKDGFPNKTYSSIEVHRKWPALVIDFLENHMSIEKQVRFNHTLQFDDEETQPIIEGTNLVGNPIRISYVSMVTREIMYWMEWVNGKKFVTSLEARTNWPDLVLTYLEANLRT
ncbi:chromobox protein homolog 5-like [Contarinia nasturtii]|uniref:chromobox protein homolog 5-like n=1 Tax=Contarinia nasturtii TaxID=265458 RepID=UPI0012D47A4C|nr:chromobox protein homolog 5-like [Contarinia nasturtii]